MALRAEKLLMRLALLLFSLAGLSTADPRIDNVLIRMVPPGSTSLVGAHMEAIRQTDLYRRMLAERKLPDVDRFAAETGFDPRRDVRELLYVTAPGQTNVMLARGTFRPNLSSMKDLKVVRHGEYNVFVNAGGNDAEAKAGFCILDATLAAAGELPAIEAALDEWKSGSHTAAQPLLARVHPASPGAQLWGVSTGVAGFLADYMPRADNGVNFSRIFRGLEDTWFEADFAAGLRASVHGRTQTDQDAVNLRDAAKGLIGLGRLSVPENQPDMLRLWDGIAVFQEGRNLLVNANIPENLMDKLVAMFSPGPGFSPAPGRGRRGR
jgi:hypothetical protein